MRATRIQGNCAVCQNELNVRQERPINRRTKAADFRAPKTLEDFNCSFNPFSVAGFEVLTLGRVSTAR